VTLDDLPLVLDADETARALRISKWSVYESVRRGEIRALRLGRTLRIPRGELIRLLGEPLRDEGALPGTHATNGNRSATTTEGSDGPVSQ
jgi:excisionase family DNA binding protein